MRRSWLLAAPVLGLMMSACHSSVPHAVPACCPPADDAHISGVLVGIGGPVRTAVQHWPGTIHLKGTVLTDFRTDGSGHFSQAVPAGTYQVTATSPSYDGGRGECRVHGPVRLRPHHTTHVRVVCQLK